MGATRKHSRLGRDLLFGAGQQTAVSEECEKSPVGKLTQEALYVHSSAVRDLRCCSVYKACGRMLLGEVTGATIVKLRRDKPKISYFAYPAFDEDPHPPLVETFIADCRELRTYHRNYAASDNPPILHRKECFVSEGYPLRDAFAKLTKEEVEAGLLSDSSEIGTQNAWQTRLAAAGYSTLGHDLVRCVR